MKTQYLDDPDVRRAQSTSPNTPPTGTAPPPEDPRRQALRRQHKKMKYFTLHTTTTENTYRYTYQVYIPKTLIPFMYQVYSIYTYYVYMRLDTTRSMRDRSITHSSPSRFSTKSSISQLLLLICNFVDILTNTQIYKTSTVRTAENTHHTGGRSS